MTTNAGQRDEHHERDHWEHVWQTKDTDQVSWFQASPEP